MLKNTFIEIKNDIGSHLEQRNGIQTILTATLNYAKYRKERKNTDYIKMLP